MTHVYQCNAQIKKTGTHDMFKILFYNYFTTLESVIRMHMKIYFDLHQRFVVFIYIHLQIDMDHK